MGVPEWVRVEHRLSALGCQLGPCAHRRLGQGVGGTAGVLTQLATMAPQVSAERPHVAGLGSHGDRNGQAKEEYGWSGATYRVGRELTGLHKAIYDAAIVFGDVL